MKNHLYTYAVEIVKIVDGDTVYAVIDLGLHTRVKRKIRLSRINAPELRDNDGKDSKTFLTELVAKYPNLIIKTTLDRNDKYGRLLGEFFTEDGNSINQMLVDGGYAVEV